jgi:hypothetical protein
MPETEEPAMGVNSDKIPFDSEHHGETGARKYLAGAASEDLYLAGAAHEDLQDGISRGGTETGDSADRPPKKGFGLTAPATDI